MRLTVLLILLLTSTACFEGRTVDTRQPDQITQTGVNMTGITSWTTEDWVRLAERACRDGAWNHEVALRIADEELRPAVDADPEVGLTDDQLGAVVWQLALQRCRDRFPDEALRQGPPGLSG